MPNPTIKTIAKEAGVSVATVSKALNDMPDISEATKVHICAIAQKQGYTINTNARQLAKGHSHSVGVLLPDITNPFCARLAQGLYTRLASAGFSLYLNDSGTDRQGETLQTLDMLQKRVGALVFMPQNGDFSHVAETVRGQIPVIYVGGLPQTGLSSCVVCNEASAGRLAARHLFQSGHRRCRVFTSASAGPAENERVRGFIDYMRRHGAEADARQAPAGLDEEAGGVSLARRMLENHRPHTAVFATSDEMALGALAAFAAGGRPAPKGISVVGYGDIPAAGTALAKLTTVRPPYTEMGIRAGDMAALWMRDEVPAETSVLLEPELVKRSTVLAL